MTFDDFVALDADAASRLPVALAALALDHAGRWDDAHERAADIETPETNRVHAYLHRKEGDIGNASYWYNRVGEPMFQGSLDEEWSQLVRRLLA